MPGPLFRAFLEKAWRYRLTSFPAPELDHIRFNAVLDSLEDPERSLNQLVLDMEEELEAAKRAAARAMANEDRLRSKIA